MCGPLEHLAYWIGKDVANVVNSRKNLIFSYAYLPKYVNVEMYFVGDKVALSDNTTSSLDFQCWSTANRECETYSVNGFLVKRESSQDLKIRVEQKGDLSCPFSKKSANCTELRVCHTRVLPASKFCSLVTFLKIKRHLERTWIRIYR